MFQILVRNQYGILLTRLGFFKPKVLKKTKRQQQKRI